MTPITAVSLVVPLDARADFNKIWNAFTSSYPQIENGFRIAGSIVAAFLIVWVILKLLGPSGNLRDRSMIPKVVGAVVVFIFGWWPKDTIGSVATIAQGLGEAVHKVVQTFLNG